MIANTNASAASVTITYLRSSGGPIVKTYTVQGSSRFTISVNARVPELQNETFASVIASTNGVPIVVERAVYWSGIGAFWAGGTNATAVVLP